MSQEKVDRRKYEKYHRKEIQRKKKIKNTILTVIAVLIVGTAIGIPLGYKIYDSIPKTISGIALDAWVSTYVQGLDGYPFIEAEEDSTDEDSTDEDSTDEETTSDSTADEGTADTAEDEPEDTEQTDASEDTTAAEDAASEDTTVE